MGRYIKSSATTTVKDEASGSITIPSGDTSERSPDPSSGDIRYNTETSALEFYDGTQFENVALQGTVLMTKDSFTGDGSTTVYTMTVTPRNADAILVFVGNVHQNPGVAYTVSGADITFTSVPPDTHTIVIMHGFDSTIVS